MGNPQIVATQDTEQLRAKLHLTIFATFTLANLQQHCLTVDVADLKIDELAQTQSCAVQGGQYASHPSHTGEPSGNKISGHRPSG